MPEFERIGDIKTDNYNLNMVVEPIKGLQQVLEELKRIDPDHVKAMRKEIITEIKPLYQKIRQAVPQSRPLSGMEHNGRTRWNQPMRVTGKVGFRTKGGKATLASIRTVSAAVEMADMAGRVGNYDVGREGSYRGVSASYNFRGTNRRHNLNGQGKALVRGLNGRVGRGASRFIWPAIESEKSFIVDRIKKILDKYADMVNRKLM